MEDPEPPPPQPIPFPIKIVNDPPEPRSDDGHPQQSEGLADRQGESRSDEFYTAWPKFHAVTPNRAKATSTLARKVKEAHEDADKGSPEGLEIAENAAKSYDQAAAECKSKVAAIVEECNRLNQKYRDAIFDLEANPYCLQTLNGRMPKAVDKIDAPSWIKRVEDIFDEPQFFIAGATATDVHQGSGGDCWFLAALMAISAKKELIEDLCVARDEKIGVYGFVFFRDGEWIYEVIDDKLFLRVGDDDELAIIRDWDKDKKNGMKVFAEMDKVKEKLQRGGEALYFSHCKSSETWLPLIEKAYAKAHGDYASIEGGCASEGIEDLTGGVGVTLNPEDIMDKDRFWKEQLSQVNVKYLFGGGSKTSPTKGMVGEHAYAVLKTWESEDGKLRLLKMRNPWGDTEWEGDWSDGSKLWTSEMMQKLEHTFGDDGVFWISYKDFIKHFTSIHRVRLFTKEWSVAQQWTSVNVPWTVDYLDTKFEITIAKSSPVVIVLSQPDDRFFYGLRGRFLYSLHFRVYNDGEERYLIRSMHNSGNETTVTRSVSTELDLEPGKYSIVFKITATRLQMGVTAEEAIQEYCVDRKEKLLSVGRRFDIAHSKGRLMEMEKANRKRRLQDDRVRQNNRYKMERKFNKEEKRRVRLRRKRAHEFLVEKKKAIDQWRAEKKKARREASEASEEEEGSSAKDVAFMEAGADAGASANTPTTEEGEKATPSEESEAPATAKDEFTSAKVQDAGKSEGIAEADTEVRPDGRSKTEGMQTEGTPIGETQPEGTQGIVQQSTPENLSKNLEKLDISAAQEPVASSAEPRHRDERDGEEALNEEQEDDDDDAPRIPEALDDDDFDWDSDMDGPFGSDFFDEEEPPQPAATSPPNELFAVDPWNAICVLGLRVYCIGADNAKIKVINSEKK